MEFDATFEDRLRILRDFDLTEYQARVYLALLRLGEAVASDIPQISRVPRTRIYSTMHQLHEKGLVLIIPESPIRYRAVPISKFIESQVESIRARAENLHASKDELTQLFGSIEVAVPEKQGRFEVIYGRRNVRQRVSKIYHLTKKEIVVIGTSKSPDRIVKARMFDIEDKHSEGVSLRFGFPQNTENRKRLATLTKFAKVRLFEQELPIYFLLADNREALITHPIPNDENHVKGDDVAIWTDDEAFVAALGMIAEDLWVRGIDPEDPDVRTALVAAAGRVSARLLTDSDHLDTALGEVIGQRMAERLRSRKLTPLLAELGKEFQARGVGTLTVLKERPLTLKLDHLLHSRGVPELGEAHGRFFGYLIKGALAARLDPRPTYREVRVLQEGAASCKIVLQS